MTVIDVLNVYMKEQDDYIAKLEAVSDLFSTMSEDLYEVAPELHAIYMDELEAIDPDFVEDVEVADEEEDEYDA